MPPKKKTVEPSASTRKAVSATAIKAFLAEQATLDASRRIQFQHCATLLSSSSAASSITMVEVEDSTSSRSERHGVEVTESLQWMHAAFTPLAAWRTLHSQMNSNSPFEEVTLLGNDDVNRKPRERERSIPLPKDSDVFILEPKSAMFTDGSDNASASPSLFLRLVDAAWAEAFPQPNLELEKYRKKVRSQLAVEVEGYFWSIRRAKGVKSNAIGNVRSSAGPVSCGLDDEAVNNLPWQYRYPLPTFSGSHLAAQCHRIQMWVQTWLRAPSESGSDSDSSSSSDSDSSDTETSSSSSSGSSSKRSSTKTKNTVAVIPAVDYVQEEQQLKDAVAAVGSLSSDLLADGWDFNCIPAGGAFFNAQGQRVSARMLRREQQLREEQREREKEMRKVKGYLAGAEPVSGSCSNFIVIQGGSGVGKTAAVYKVAEEMHCKVVEINPSIRRSAKFLEEAFAEATQAKTLRLNGSNLKVQQELSLIKGSASKPKPHTTGGGESAAKKKAAEGGNKSALVEIDGEVVVAQVEGAQKKSGGKPAPVPTEKPRKKPNVISKEAIAKFFAPRKPNTTPQAAAGQPPQPKAEVLELDAELVHDVDCASEVPTAVQPSLPSTRAAPPTAPIEIDVPASSTHPETIVITDQIKSTPGSSKFIDIERSPSVGLIESTVTTVTQRLSSDSVAPISSSVLPIASPGGVTNTAISSTGTIVLIEAGDVVFDDEPGLYAAIKRIAVASKVPVIITATDFTEEIVHSTFGSDVPMISVEPPTHRLFLYLQLAAIIMANYVEVLGEENNNGHGPGDRAPLSSVSFGKLVRSLGNLLFSDRKGNPKVQTSPEPTVDLCSLLKRFLDQVGDADVRKVLAALQYRLLPLSLTHSRKRERHSDGEEVAEETFPVAEPLRRVNCFASSAHLNHRQAILCFLQRSVTVERHRHLLQEVERFDVELWEEEQAADAAQETGMGVTPSDSKQPVPNPNEGTRSNGSGSGTPTGGAANSLFKTLFLNAQQAAAASTSGSAKKLKSSTQGLPAFSVKTHHLALLETPFTELFSPNHEAYLDPTTIQTRQMIEAEDDDEDDKRLAFLEYAKSRKKLKAPNFTRSTEFLCDYLCHGRPGSNANRLGNSPTTDSRQSPINLLAE
jgi:hypothetical protein